MVDKLLKEHLSGWLNWLFSKERKPLRFDMRSSELNALVLANENLRSKLDVLVNGEQMESSEWASLITPEHLLPAEIGKSRLRQSVHQTIIAYHDLVKAVERVQNGSNFAY